MKDFAFFSIFGFPDTQVIFTCLHKKGEVPHTTNPVKNVHKDLLPDSLSNSSNYPVISCDI
jgi:hypothetical protein